MDVTVGKKKAVRQTTNTLRLGSFTKLILLTITNNEHEKFLDIAETSFKERYINHKRDFKHESI